MLKIDLGKATAFSTERGSEATVDDAYSGFNACHYTGDNPAHVAKCRRELARELGISEESLVIPRQTHSDRVKVIDSLPVEPEQPEGVDGLVTALRGVALCINTADCVPVVLSDPEAGVIAAAHCGWRGVVNNLLPNVLAAMEQLGAQRRNILAAMGPSIGVECFEVGEEVANIFDKEFKGDGMAVRAEGEEVVVRAEGKKPHVNLGAAIKEKLTSGGLKPENIQLPKHCSRCHPERFFSARALGIASGRTLTAVMQ